MSSVRNDFPKPGSPAIRVSFPNAIRPGHNHDTGSGLTSESRTITGAPSIGLCSGIDSRVFSIRVSSSALIVAPSPPRFSTRSAMSPPLGIPAHSSTSRTIRTAFAPEAITRRATSAAYFSPALSWSGSTTTSHPDSVDQSALLADSDPWGLVVADRPIDRAASAAFSPSVT